jgi:hypothetical protein
MTTIEQLQARLREIHARIGFDGRFSFTINQEEPEPKCYVTHWFRSSDYAFEDCKAVGLGTLDECLAALDRYADNYRRRPTQEEIGRTLGVIPASHPDRYSQAAE